jgi:hypothetical protein
LYPISRRLCLLNQPVGTQLDDCGIVSPRLFAVLRLKRLELRPLLDRQVVGLAPLRILSTKDAPSRNSLCVLLEPREAALRGAGDAQGCSGRRTPRVRALETTFTPIQAWARLLA